MVNEPVMVKMSFPQFNFSPNSLVSMHQFGTNNKVGLVGISPNNSFIPASKANSLLSIPEFSAANKLVGGFSENNAFESANNDQHYQNSSNQVSFTNNIHVSSAPAVSSQNHYHNTQNVSNQNIVSNSGSSTTATATTSVQTAWPDGAKCVSSNGHNLTSLPLPSYSQSHQSQRTSIGAPVMKSVATMTDFVIPLQNSGKKTTSKVEIITEDSYDSSKSSNTENNSFKCSNPCTKIYLKSNASAMAEYLDRLQQSVIPSNIDNFLKNYSVTADFCKEESSDTKKSCVDNGKDIAEIRLTTAVDGSLLYCCSECQMAFSQKELLERHLSAHRLERKFECNVCGVCLKRKEHLDQHKKGHSEDRPFVCEICCKGFKRNEHLRRHIVIHSGDKSHVCAQCGKAFSRKDHLNKHLQTHINKPPKQETSEPTSPILQIQTQNLKNIGHS